ncbi:Heterokaryon incompatibility protein (HET) domain containing protein [Naviculisporaceae sp. PSN 640]
MGTPSPGREWHFWKFPLMNDSHWGKSSAVRSLLSYRSYRRSQVHICPSFSSKFSRHFFVLALPSPCPYSTYRRLPDVNITLPHMPYIARKDHFDPHRTVLDGGLVIKPWLRSLYPYIERLRYPDYDQDELPQEYDPIDVSRIREWLSQCDQVHGNHCQGTVTDSIGRPTFFIDVHRMCLVPAEGRSYVTLSYVWGNAPCVSLSSQTCAQLLVEGSLRREDMPRVIRESVELVRLLGQTHLWVDRLCIDQHDGATKKGQIAAMADIYANSCLTIVAAEGNDASKPLCPRGFKDEASLRTSDTKVDADTRPHTRTRRRSRVMEDLSWSLVTESTWSTRGWTFQEQYSSRRKLIFHGNTVTWECHCEAWNEMDNDQCIANTRQCPPIPRPPSRATSTGLHLGSWPDFHLFTRMVCLFNVRHLTFQSDALDALEGLLSVFGTVFRGGFISGLPKMIFDAALLWQPYYPMERRSDNRGVRFDDPRIPPSWSWLGFWGSLHSEDLLLTFNYVIHEDPAMRLPPTSTASTVPWSHSITLDGLRTPIEVSAAGYRERYQGKHEDLPPGWHAIGSSANFLPCGTQRRRRSSINSDLMHYYWHDDVGDCTQRFWYPVPIVPSSASPGPSPSHRPRFLHGTTRVIAASLGVEIVGLQPQIQLGDKFNPKRCADACIRVKDTGKWIGYMRLNESVDSLLGLSPGSCLGIKREDEIVIEENCTLIELSRGSATYDKRLLDRYVEYLYPAMAWHRVVPGQNEVYEFVNVMWVEMLDASRRVVRRKGIGRVAKGAWGRLASGDFEVSIS